MEYEFHPAADLFPMMSDEEIDALGDDMLEHAQREAIILFRGQILDGRNRYRACIARGIEPKFREERPADPYAFVASANLHRRHLDAGQRAMIAESLAMLRDGQHKAGASGDAAATQTDAAKLLEVSRPSVQRARYVREHGVPDLVDAVERGDVKIRPAAEFASAVPPLDQQRLIAEHGSPAAAVKATVKAKAQSQIVIAQVQNPARIPRIMSAADVGPVVHDIPDLQRFAKFCRERDPVIITRSVREFERATFQNDIDDIARWIHAVQELLMSNRRGGRHDD
jgi:ParB-like chromosome segregation protein Spo0J